MKRPSVVIDKMRWEVRVGGKRVHFTMKEFNLFSVLYEADGVVLSREQLIEGVWEGKPKTGTRTVDQHVAKIRRKTEEFGEFIETVQGIGYRLAPKK